MVMADPSDLGHGKKTAPDGADRQTNKQTDEHGDSMTESAQWGRFSENCKKTAVSFENSPLDSFWPFWTFWRVLRSPFCGS